MYQTSAASRCHVTCVTCHVSCAKGVICLMSSDSYVSWALPACYVGLSPAPTWRDNQCTLERSSGLVSGIWCHLPTDIRIFPKHKKRKRKKPEITFILFVTSRSLLSPRSSPLSLLFPTSLLSSQGTLWRCNNQWYFRKSKIIDS